MYIENLSFTFCHNLAQQVVIAIISIVFILRSVSKAFLCIKSNFFIQKKEKMLENMIISLKVYFKGKKPTSIKGTITLKKDATLIFTS